MTRPILILGTGPTLKDFDVGRFFGRAFIIAVNDAYRVCPWADMFYACDFDWWVYHGVNMMHLTGQKVTCRWNDDTPKHVMVSEVRAVPNQRRGWSMEKDVIYLGHNSGFQALQLAAQRKPPAIFMAGFDMGVTGETHFFGQHPPQLAVGSVYSDFIGDFENAIDQIKACADVKLVTSPSGLSHLFETISVEDAIDELQTASCS